MVEKPLFLELKLIEENRKAILKIAKMIGIDPNTFNFNKIPKLNKEQLKEIEDFNKPKKEIWRVEDIKSC